MGRLKTTLSIRKLERPVRFRSFVTSKSDTSDYTLKNKRVNSLHRLFAQIKDMASRF